VGVQCGRCWSQKSAMIPDRKSSSTTAEYYTVEYTMCVWMKVTCVCVCDCVCLCAYSSYSRVYFAWYLLPITIDIGTL
jgi:hypothetical protein